MRKVRRELRDDQQKRQVQLNALRADEKHQLESLEAGYWRGVFAQVETVKMLARLLPSGCLTHALVGLTGTDTRYVSDFQTAHKRVKEAYAASLKNPAPDHRFGVDPQDVHAGSYGKVSPELEIFHPNFDERLSGILLDIGLLAGYLILFFAASYIGFLRYDIR